MTRSETALVHSIESPTTTTTDERDALRATEAAALALYSAHEHKRARAIAAALTPTPVFEREKSLFGRMFPSRSTAKPGESS